MCPMDFSDALRVMKAGGHVRRRYWADSLGGNAGAYAFLVTAVVHGDEKVPAIMVRLANGDLKFFSLSQCDALAEDWEAVSPISPG
jgi:hypothetical protein